MEQPINTWESFYEKYHHFILFLELCRIADGRKKLEYSDKSDENPTA